MKTEKERRQRIKQRPITEADLQSLVRVSEPMIGQVTELSFQKFVRMKEQDDARILLLGREKRGIQGITSFRPVEAPKKEKIRLK